ncbi:MAG: hypothetical protein JXA78_01355 [Anaerolineales bacterium]|nr:hypothetical protein [Anaerolineales bacterium]
MSAPLIWIIVPGAAAIGLYVFRRRRLAVNIAGLLIALALAGLAWQIPISEPISLRLWAGFPAWEITDSLTLFGRQFVLENTSRPALIVIYLGLGFWFGGAYLARTDPLFIPLGLVIAALSTASLAAEPGYYGLLIIEGAVLACIPVLSPPGNPLKRGVLRFLTFQSIGMCFVLLGDWSLPYINAEASAATSVPPGALLIGFGFLLMIAAFPFHTWIPMLAEEAHPYAAAFVFYSLPTAILFLALEYLDRYSLLGISTRMYTALLAVGALMILSAGVWAAFERHLGRIFGFAAIQQIGAALLAVSLTDEAQTNSPFAGLFFAQLAPQAVNLAVWALALYAIRSRTGDLRFSAVQGLARHMPVAAASLVLTNFSAAGMPLLANFPVYVALWSALAQRSLGIALLSLIGSACLFAAGVRSLAVLVRGLQPQAFQLSERGPLTTLLLLGAVMLMATGLMPQWFFPLLTNLGLVFTRPGP